MALCGTLAPGFGIWGTRNEVHDNRLTPDFVKTVTL